MNHRWKSRGSLCSLASLVILMVISKVKAQLLAATIPIEPTTAVVNSLSVAAQSIGLIPQVKLNRSGLSDSKEPSYQTYAIPNDTSLGIYNHYFLQDKLTFGCGVYYSIVNGSSNSSDEKLNTSLFEIKLTLTSGSKEYLTSNCSGSSCFVKQQEPVIIGQQTLNASNQISFFPEKDISDHNNLFPLGSQNNVTIRCSLMRKGNDRADNLVYKSTFEWWMVPDSISIQPKLIKGYQEAGNGVEVQCKSVGGYPTPQLTLADCENCEKNLSTTEDITTLTVQVQLTDTKHHTKKLVCVNENSMSITGELEAGKLDRMRAETEPIVVYTLGRNFRSLYSLKGVKSDVKVDARSYIKTNGNVTFSWMTEPPISGADGSREPILTIAYSNRGASPSVNVTCRIRLVGSPEDVTDEEAKSKRYFTALTFEVYWAVPDIMDTLVFYLLIFFVILVIATIVMSASLTYRNYMRKKRRGTIATGIGDSFDEEDQKFESSDDGGQDEAIVDIAPDGTVTVTMRRVSSVAATWRASDLTVDRKLSTAAWSENFETVPIKGIAGPRRGTLVERRVSLARRQTMDERRKSLANEALLIADTVRKSLAPGGQTRGVSFAAPNAGGEGLKEEDEKEGTTVKPGTAVYIRSGLIVGRWADESDIKGAAADNDIKSSKMTPVSEPYIKGATVTTGASTDVSGPKKPSVTKLKATVKPPHDPISAWPKYPQT